MADEQTPQSGGQAGEPSYPTYTPPTSNPAPETPEPKGEQLPPTHVPYGNKQSYSGTYPPPPGSSGGVTIIDSDLVSTRTAKGCGGIAFAIMLFTFIPVVIGIIFAIRAISGGFDELDDGLGNPFSSEDRDLRTPEAFEKFLDEVREETGGTTVFEATIYKEHISAYVPADSSSKRYYSYYYDGGDLRKSSQGSTDYARFDLATIDPSVLGGLFDKAETLVEDPKSTYVIIRSPQEHMKGAWFSVHANNDFMESGYFTADKTGKVVMEYLSQ